MSPPVVAVIVGVTLATFLFLMYKRGSKVYEETCSPHYQNTYSYPGTRRSSACEEKCIICLYPLVSEKIAALPCTHKFHEKCIKEWIHKAGRPTPCPYCRFKFYEYVNC